MYVLIAPHKTSSVHFTLDAMIAQVHPSALVALVSICLSRLNLFIHAEEISIHVLYQNVEVMPRFMAIRGDGLPGLNWTTGIPMNASLDVQNAWVLNLTVDEFKGKEFSFKILFDDRRWQLGANFIGIANAGIIVVAPWFVRTTGFYWVAERAVPSKYFQNTRDVVVYVPPGYLENSHPRVKFETLIACDGENVFNDSTSFGGVSWNAQATLDENILAGTMRPIVVLAPYNTNERMSEYTPVNGTGPDSAPFCRDNNACGHGDEYLAWVEQVLLPLVAPKYRLSVDRKSLGFVGSSLGGLLSCYACWTRTTYQRCICMSSSFWWSSNWTITDLIPKHKPPPKDTIFYLDSGDQPAPNGDDKIQTIQVRDEMISLGWSLGKNLFYFLQPGGQHNEASWASRFHVPLQEVYSPKLYVPQQ